jgi:hypothetical protein
MAARLLYAVVLALAVLVVGGTLWFLVALAAVGTARAMPRIRQLVEDRWWEPK